MFKWDAIARNGEHGECLEKRSRFVRIFILCRKDVVLPPPLLCRDITEADMIADAVSNTQLISV